MSRCSRRAGSAAATPAAIRPSSAPIISSRRAPRSTIIPSRCGRSLSQSLNYNVMFSPRGVMMLAHTVHDIQVFKRHVHANRCNGVDNEWLEPAASQGVLPAAQHRGQHPLSGAGRRASAARRHRAARCRRLGLCARRRRVRASTSSRTARSPASQRDAAAARSKAWRPRAAHPYAQGRRLGGRQHERRLGLAGVRLPLESYPLQALVSEPIKPIFPCVVMSNTIHAYISQSDKGELVIGAGTDAYTSYTQRGALHINTHTLDAICELFPTFRRLRMLRNWGGIVDVTPDRSPIIAKTPVKGLYVNCGWGTGGFKATPGSAHVFAWTIARDEPHPINAPFTIERFRDGYPDRRGRGRRRGSLRGPMLLIVCPYCGKRPEIEFTYGGQAHLARAARPAELDDQAWTDFLYMRAIPRASMPNAGATRAVADASSMRCATRPPTIFWRPTRRASRRRNWRRVAARGAENTP
jgi:sarcosine oxidase subunit beta